jgi:hypothetical protein
MGKPTTFNKMPPITDAVVEIVEAKKGVEAVEVPARITDSTGLKFGSIEIPLGPLPGYIKRRVDIGRMSREQSERLGEITSGLQFSEATLKNGTRVKSELHAIRWVLENLNTGKP